MLFGVRNSEIPRAATCMPNSLHVIWETKTIAIWTEESKNVEPVPGPMGLISNTSQDKSSDFSCDTVTLKVK